MTTSPRRAPRLRHGCPYPLGATVVPGGVNFAIYSRHATGVRLLLFDSPEDREPAHDLRLTARSAFVWHALVEGLGPGALYAYRVEGPYQPQMGHRFNPHKVLVDPYAKALHGDFDFAHGNLFPYDRTSPHGDLSFDDTDDCAAVPRCVVVDDAFDWQGVGRPAIAPEDLVLYEAHVKGMTAHPSAKVACPGTFLGLIDLIPYLVDLGVNALELLPVHQTVTEPWLAEKGLVNYWGYNTIAFFAPDRRFAWDTTPGSQVRELKTLVRELHRAGIEVILDVVYNHSGEGNHLGPLLSLRGIDNRVYYRLREDSRLYDDVTGCGNTLNLGHPAVLRLVMDSLRYFVEVMQVDGFRFDLASALGRGPKGFDQVSSFFNLVHQDPVISRVRLIAEPWDVGPGGYQVGNFPPEWMEWNGRYRDTVRRFWRGDAWQLSDLMLRLMGSPDLYADDGRSPFHSVNFVTCHDGFTLRDLVSYERKHNEQNGEDNRDGTDDNASCNCGVEGETDDPGVLAARARQQRNLLATLLLAQGIPMLLAGDQFGRTQRGNNNAYCQDNELSWLDWELLRRDASLHRFVRVLLRFRRAHATLRRRGFPQLGDEPGVAPHLTFYGVEGRLPALADGEARALALRLDGDGVGPEGDERDADLFLMLNAGWEAARFAVPPPRDEPWRRVIDTSLAGDDAIVETETPQGYPLVTPTDAYVLPARSRALLIGARSG
jgi:isoamylase